MFGVLKDCCTPMLKSQHLETPQDLIAAFDRETTAQVKEASIDLKTAISW